MKLTSIRIRHFKAVQDSGTIRFGPLTAFVGYNGTGKSSVVEACEFLQTYALAGMEAALTPWFSFDSILWQGAERKKVGQPAFFSQPLEIEVAGRVPKSTWRAGLEIGELAEDSATHAARSVVVRREFLKVGKSAPLEYHLERRERGRPKSGSQVLDSDASVNFRDWLFLSLNGRPGTTLQKATKGTKRPRNAVLRDFPPPSLPSLPSVEMAGQEGPYRRQRRERRDRERGSPEFPPSLPSLPSVEMAGQEGHYGRQRRERRDRERGSPEFPPPSSPLFPSVEWPARKDPTEGNEGNEETRFLRILRPLLPSFPFVGFRSCILCTRRRTS
ncbi:MAG: AAA family ATPase [Verrucomicrobiales bacterium]|nr:AAA family ATPase [Verrucomicrobiales bacterium]